MRKVKLGNPEIAKVCAGQSAPQDAYAFGDSGYAFIRAGSLEYLCDGGDTKNLEHINAEMAKKYRLKLFPKDTVTFAKSGMSAKIGRIYKLKEPAYIVSHLAAIIPQDNLDADYLAYFLKTNPPANLIPNDAYPSIRLSEIENISINLPPISDQRRIAAILDKADAICRKRKECIKMLDELVKARFVEMFGTFPTNEKKWKVCKIADIVTDVKYGTSRPAKENGKYNYLRMNNITYDGNLDLSDIKQIDIPDKELPRCTVKFGDVLFNRTNSRELVGKTCVYNLKETMVLAGFIIRIRLNNLMLPEFLSAFLNTDFSKKMLFAMCKAAIGQANINAQELQNIKLYLPPLEDQTIFVSFMNKVNENKTVMQTQLQEAETLKAALMQQYFSQPAEDKICA